MRVRILYWLSLTILPFWIGASQSSASTSLLIRNVTIIDGTGRAPVREMSVVISDRRITPIGAASTIKAPAGVTVIDGTGKFLIPGLWNMHAHLGAYPDALHNPESLAELSGRKKSNLSRTLTTMEHYGLVSLKEGPRGSVIPCVHDVQQHHQCGADPAGVFSASQPLLLSASVYFFNVASQFTTMVTGVATV